MVVMPFAHRSFYRNTYSQQRYFDFIADELPEICQSNFPISNLPARRLVAGQSMGGYGAFKLALTYPERYAAAASLSGALDIGLGEDLSRFPEWPHVFGPVDKLSPEDDLLELSRRVAAANSLPPKLYQFCGTEDFLYGSNERFLRNANECGLAIDYQEGPGAHDWDCWDKRIEAVLQWLPIKRLGTEN